MLIKGFFYKVDMKDKFEDIVKKLSPTLRRITHKLNGNFTFFDEDDLFQEALEHLWVHYNSNMLDDKTDSYVLQGCYFHLKNCIRRSLDKVKLVSLQKLTEEGEGSLESFLGYEDRSISDNVESSSINESEGIKKLSSRELEVLKLSMNGSTVREIGAKLGISHVMVIKIKKGMRHYLAPMAKKPKTGYQN
jgi:RNA polymerase sigma factor (sigma-70 family)